MNSKKNTLSDHKQFIIAVATELISPNNSNDILKEVLELCKEVKELNKVEVLNGCSDCNNQYAKSFQTILDYLNKKK